MCIYPDENKLFKYLTTKSLGKKAICVDDIPSTNTLAKEYAKQGAPHGTVVIARNQTDGRGRLDRCWQSSSEGSLCMSVILRPSITSDLLPRYVIAAAYSVANGLNRAYRLNTSIKWPNDILLDGKKLCGILMESGFSGDTCDYVICGIGINVNNHFNESTEEYLSTIDPGTVIDIDRIATSLYDKFHLILEREKVAAVILNALEYTFNRCHTDASYAQLLKEYKGLSCVLGKDILILKNGETIEGKALDLDPLGRIIISIDGKPATYDVGDISIRRKEQL